MRIFGFARQGVSKHSPSWIMEDDEKIESFVPSSLASFISKAQATLDDLQNSLHLESPAKSNASVSMDQDTSFASMREDEDDKKLKQELLDKLQQRNEKGLDKDENKESSILESANLLLALDEEEEIAAHEILSGKTADTPLSPAGEGVEFSLSDLLSPGSDTMSPDDGLARQSKRADAVQDRSPSNFSKDTTIDTKTEERLSGSSRASGWKNLIASVPTKSTDTPKSALERGTEFIESSDLRSKTGDKNQTSQSAGRDITPKSVREKVVEPKTVDFVTTPKDNATSVSCAPIPATIDPMAMSCALEVTSPFSVNENTKLSASTPELGPSSPWRNAFQSMVSRLEDRGTPPTPDQSTPSPTAKQSPPEDVTSKPVPANVKPSWVIPQSPPVLSRRSTSRPQQEESTEKPAPRKSGLILSPSDSLPSPQVTRHSGLILSPSDSLPNESPQSTKSSELASSPVASMSSALPPSTGKTSTMKASPQSTTKNAQILSPTTSLPKASPQATSLPKASPQAVRNSGLTLSPSDSLGPPASAAKSDVISSPVVASPQSKERTEKIASPSDPLGPPASVEKNGMITSPAVAPPQSTGKTEQIASLAPVPMHGPSPSSAEKSGQIASPPSALLMASPSTAKHLSAPGSSSLKGSRPTAKTNKQLSSPASLPKAPPHSTEKIEAASSPAASLVKSSPLTGKTSEQSSSPASLSPKAQPPSTGKSDSAFEKSGQISSPVAPLWKSTSPMASLPKASPSSEVKSGKVSPPAASFTKASPQPAGKSGLFSSLASLMSSPSPSSAGKSEDAQKNVTPSNTLPKGNEAMKTKDEIEATAVTPPASMGTEDHSYPAGDKLAQPSKVEVTASATPQNKVIPSPVKSRKSASGSEASTLQKPEKTMKEAVAAEPESTSKAQISTKGDAVLANERPVVTGTSLARQPAPASKSEASKCVTQSKANINERIPATTKNIDQPSMPATSTRTITVSKQRTSTSSTVSRLFQGSASSQAHSQVATTSNSKPINRTSTTTNRLSRGTPASGARSKMASSTSKPVARNAPSVEDGRMKARERVRQQKLDAETKRAEAAAYKPESNSRTRGTTLTAEEGRALARERVRRLQAASKEKSEGAVPSRTFSVKGKENQVRPSNQTAESTISMPPRSVSRGRRTIPKSTELTTKAILGEKASSSTSVREGSRKLDPNPITRALGSPSHSDRTRDSTARSSSSSSRKLTVPRAPRLSTMAKYGDKPPPSVQEKTSKPDSQPRPPPRKQEFKPTQPVPFKFHSSKTVASSPPSRNETELSLAEMYATLFTQRAERRDSIGSAGDAERQAHHTKDSPFLCHFETRSAERHSRDGGRDDEVLQDTSIQGGPSRGLCCG